MNEIIVDKIKEKMKEISLILMEHENKSFCFTKISPLNWRSLSYNRELHCIITPSPLFNRFIINREYLEVVKNFPFYFGTKNDWNIIRALKEYDKENLLKEYSDCEFFNCIRTETMAYVFKIEPNQTLSNRILRLDLCRNIDIDNVFQGGIFHVFKHFTPDGFETISSNNKEFKVKTFHNILKYIIMNFFSDTYHKENGIENCYEAISSLEDGHILRGIYYKEDDIPISFIKSIRIDSSPNKSK